MQLNVKLTSPHSRLPNYAHQFDAAVDLHSASEYDIPPNSRQLISTGIAISWEGKKAENYYFRIAPRSGLAVKSIDVGAGICDYNYRGDIKVLLINNSKDNFHVNIGDRIAQGILTKIGRFEIINVVDELNDTDRGQNGFGSSGI